MLYFIISKYHYSIIFLVDIKIIDIYVFDNVSLSSISILDVSHKRAEKVLKAISWSGAMEPSATQPMSGIIKTTQGKKDKTH